MSKEFRAARAANTSLKLSDARFLQLTAQVRQVYERIDGALAQALRLNADMIETAQEIGLEPEVGQKLFVDLTECVGTMMQSREDGCGPYPQHRHPDAHQPGRAGRWLLAGRYHQRAGCYPSAYRRLSLNPSLNTA